MKEPVIGYILLAAIGWSSWTSAPTKAEQRPKTYSVCEVLGDLQSFKGKIIAVRGVVHGGGHGAFLAANCASKLVVRGYTWPDTIWLEFPSKSDTRFKVDFDAYERVQRVVKRQGRREGEQLIITYEGILEAKDLSNNTAFNSAGRLVGWGYGPGNDAPAQLVVRTLRDPEVLRKAEQSASKDENKK